LHIIENKCIERVANYKLEIPSEFSHTHKTHVTPDDVDGDIHTFGLTIDDLLYRFTYILIVNCRDEEYPIF